MKAVSLFAGIGGFDLALERNGHKVVYANEYNKYAAKVYRKHFKEVDTRDIRTVVGESIPFHDILVAGFPCQAFSVAGKRAGFNDTRGTLFFEIARILKDKRPRYFLLENVKGLLSHDGGQTFQTILRILAELGYDVQWQVLNSKDFGVPQNRERVFIVGHIRGQSRPKVFPIEASNRAYSKQFASTAIDSNYWKGIDNHGARTSIVQLNQPTHSNDRIYGDDGLSPTLNTAQGGLRQPKVLVPYGKSQDQKLNPLDGVSQTLSAGHYNQPKIVQRVPLKFLERNQKNIEGDYAYTVDSMNTGGVMIVGGLQDHQTPRKDGVSPALPSAMGMGGGHTPIVWSDDVRIRRLTPTECERLQGFPDGWTKGLSDTQRYKCLGNAVTVNVVEAIVSRL